MIHRGSAVPLGAHESHVARDMLDAVDRALVCGTLEHDRIVREGRSLRLDDGCTGHAGLVLELPPHDTGPFADRERELRLHIDDRSLLDAIDPLPVPEGVSLLVRRAREIVDLCSSPRIRRPGSDAALGGRYVTLLACERSTRAEGERVSTSVIHPWCDVPGRQGGPLPLDRLEIDLPRILHCIVSWDAVDVDVTIQGLQHHASVRAADDPMTALRMTAELDALRASMRR
jgi:hypothetical protein